MSFTTVTVTGTINDSAGNPLENTRVQFSLTQNLVSTDDGIMVSNAPQTVVTDENGDFSIKLAATDDETTTPSGQAYACRILSPGGSTYNQFGVNSSFPVYYFALPASSAPTVTLNSLIYSTAPYTYGVGATGPSGPSGPSGATGRSGATGPQGPTGPSSSLYYGSFYDTTTQTNVAGATGANLITFNTTDVAGGISIVSNSKITFANAGAYCINFLGQFITSGGGSNYAVTVWYTINGGAPATGSGFTFTTAGVNNQVLANVEDTNTFNAGDYIQFYWWSQNTYMELLYTAAGSNPTRPFSPSVNLNVFNVG